MPSRPPTRPSSSPPSPGPEGRGVVTVGELVRAARRHLPAPLAGEAELLVAAALGTGRAQVMAFPERTVDAATARRCLEWIARRAAGAPLAYLTGTREFHGLELEVTPATLVPRPETELLVEAALARLPAGAPARMADLGTGCGAVALAIARARPEAEVLATDRSAAALEVARRNAARLGLANVRFRHGDWCAALAGEPPFDLIVSNPPYVPEGNAALEADGVRAEPREALAAGPDGLDAIRAIARCAPRHLRPNGWLLLEHGAAQAAAVRGLLAAQGLEAVETLRDLAGRERVTGGRRPPGAV